MLVPDYALYLLRAFSGAAAFVSATGQIHAANAAAREALGIALERPADCHMGSLVADPEKLTDLLRTWSRSTEPAPGSFAVHREGAIITFNAKGAVVFPQAGDSPSLLLVRFWARAEGNPFVLLNQKIAQLNDEVARRVQVEEALRRSEVALRERAREAEALNRAKDEFLATVSHELRTPLNAILGWSSLLRARGVEGHVAKGIEVIHRNAEAQAQLIDDILDVSRIITGKLLLETNPTDLAIVVAEAIEVVRPSAAAKQIEIAFLHPPEPCSLIADPDRLRQVVWNLLSNAVKFTERGGSIRVEIGRTESRITVVVADTGRGIDPGFLPFVFDRFRQADSSTTRRTGGLGLGLALVRHIVELHGGHVAAASDGPGRGATFTITLPVRAVITMSESPRPCAASEVQPARPKLTLQGLKILVVEDEADARELLAAVLTDAGAEVETAGAVGEGFDAFARFRPHVLVSDIGLPGEDGYSFMRKLRSLGASDGGVVPSVALTAYTRAEDRTKALAAGFTTHIGKPVNPDDLVSAVANLSAFAVR